MRKMASGDGQQNIVSNATMAAQIYDGVPHLDLRADQVLNRVAI